LDFASLNIQLKENEISNILNQDKSSKQLNINVDANSGVNITQSQIDNKSNEIKRHREPKVIVILGGGVRDGAIDMPQYQNQDVSKEAMKRLRMGARLAKSTQLPILVTGGRPDRTSSKDNPEGEIMAKVLEIELGVKTHFIENQSNTTQENAKFSAKILKENQINSIYLVTNDWHLPRAIKIFEKQGLNVIPVPTGYQYQEKMTPLDYLPSMEGLELTRRCWHEIMGSMWYALKY
jgi:uncharacterized SAM-binding protein YcdF (DUF218 family)